MCVALGQNGSITYENPAVIWNCPVVTWDQFFWPAYGFNDGNGHACYVFISAKAQIESPNLWEVLEPYMFYMNDGNPVVINQEVGNSAEYWCAY